MGLHHKAESRKKFYDLVQASMSTSTDNDMHKRAQRDYRIGLVMSGWDDDDPEKASLLESLTRME